MIVSGSSGNTLNSFYKLVTESLKMDDETKNDSMEEGDHSVLAMEIQERFHGASRFYTFSVCKLVFLRGRAEQTFFILDFFICYFLEPFLKLLLQCS